MSLSPPRQFSETPPAGFRDVQLELSLKPFFDASPATREAVCREVFEQWRALWRHAETVSILLWLGDGSEILEYEGRLEIEMEWGRYHGAANPHRRNDRKQKAAQEEDRAGTGVSVDAFDPEGLGLHRRPYLYRSEPAVFTYGWLRDLVSDLKRIGSEATSRPVYVGETFDIGPEFAKSRFKYEWHPEILGHGPIFQGEFITCEAILAGDNRRYAGFHDGIPEGTTFGRFLGRQCRCLFEDCGFDFLWLSNGFGFSLEPWALVGEVFNGQAYHPERAEGIAERVLGFWRDLRSELPVLYPIRSRGTNMATGIDLGSDASPLRQIYEGGFAVEAPVNSPWAAIDGDIGLELSGWMSHMVRHPGETYRYRFYTHDPWWMNSPYLDRYERQPHDIYLPLSVSRLQSDGSVEIPRDLAFLSVDDSMGNLPVSVPNEVTAHLLRARETPPDEAGPLVWLYPFDDYHDMVQEGGQPGLPLYGDALVGTLLNHGIPLNTVVEAKHIESILSTSPSWPKGKVFLTPVPLPGSQLEAAVEAILKVGGGVLLYGPLPEGSPHLTRLGLALDEALEGDFQLEADGLIGAADRTLRLNGFLSGGGAREVVGEGGCHILATLKQAGQQRVLAAESREGQPGHLCWTRAPLATAEYDLKQPKPIRGPILRPLDPDHFVAGAEVVRLALQSFGWTIRPEVTEYEKRSPYLTIHRHRNACYFSGYHQDERAKIWVRLPLGAPLLQGRHNEIRDGATAITGQVAWQHEVRVFVEKSGDSVIRARELPAVMHGVHRRVLLSGLQAARLHFLVDTGAKAPVRILHDPHFPYFVGDFVEPIIKDTTMGPFVTIENANGNLLLEF